MRSRIVYLGHHAGLAAHMRRHRVRYISAREAWRALLLSDKYYDLEVDHIVPKTMGGLDHPMNYALVPAALRRQWGCGWTDHKRATLGYRITQSACDFCIRHRNVDARSRDSLLC